MDLGEIPAKSDVQPTEAVMTEIPMTQELLKQAVKDAVAESLREQRDLLHDVFTEVLEDIALAEAIREGRQTGFVDREEVIRLCKREP